MIKVIRTDFKERTIRKTRGYPREKIIPAHYECSYRYGNLEIAHYDSRYDVLDLRSDYISKDFSKSKYERALEGEYKDAYKFLFDMLGADSTTHFSEYTYA